MNPHTSSIYFWNSDGQRKEQDPSEVGRSNLSVSTLATGLNSVTQINGPPPSSHSFAHQNGRIPAFSHRFIATDSSLAGLSATAPVVNYLPTAGFPAAGFAPVDPRQGFFQPSAPPPTFGRASWPEASFMPDASPPVVEHWTRSTHSYQQQRIPVTAPEPPQALGALATQTESPPRFEAGMLTAVFGSKRARAWIRAFVHPKPVPNMEFDKEHGDKSRARYLTIVVPREMVTCPSGALVPVETRSRTIRIDVLNKPAVLGIPYPQHMFQPGGGPGDPSYTRNALKATLLPTVLFEDVNGKLGVSLSVALGASGRLASVLRNAEMPAEIGEGTTKFILVWRRGFEMYKHQIRLDGAPKSHGDFLKCNASAIERSILPEENLRLDDIKVLYSVNVSKGCWQAVFSHCDPARLSHAM
ncbi:hypothetical protein K488DRAFT_84978 [Vararia minispora EC-137]|uniref:Uncharacterized protein n=1 Tax=Vararia minispora EC-137 TaxID=1314806 RepID=A0ACB8QNW1_9AGAM|nr:hypothetical protein K488DRAFT_84978 [Vararia minispora EC-137]